MKTIINVKKILPWDYLPLSNHGFQRIIKKLDKNKQQNVNVKFNFNVNDKGG